VETCAFGGFSLESSAPFRFCRVRPSLNKIDSFGFAAPVLLRRAVPMRTYKPRVNMMLYALGIAHW
jgi:hypothetical protein